MPPLKKTPPVSRKGSQMDLIANMKQAGRSETALGAEVNAAQLRSVASAPSIRRDFEGPRSSSKIPAAAQVGELPAAQPLSRRASSTYVPAISSPLNPLSARTSSSGPSEDEQIGVAVSSTESSSMSNGGSTTADQSQQSKDAASKQPRKPGPNTLSAPQMMLRQKSATSVRSGYLRPETPRTLKDLGGDYSRYPRSDSMSTFRASPRIPMSVVSAADSSTSLLRTTTKNPFSDSQADLEKFGYPDDSIGAFDPYYGGEKGFILYSNEVEADDKFHLPQDDDDIVYKPKASEYFDRRSIISTIGGIFLVLGLLAVFIVLPILTYSTHLLLGQSSSGNGILDTGPAWAHVNNRTYALLNNVRRGLIDPDTPDSAKTRISTFDGSALHLVFSDEFNDNNRTFYPGDDPYWTAGDLWYGATQDMEWYDPDAVTTYGGTLQLRLDQFASHGLNYRSGMLNSWNQMCFKGGVFEISASLAGPSGVPGLWPGAWTIGNLGRPGYKATTEGVWPYTYDSCDYGITPNQSDPTGLSNLPGQKLSACTCKGADHPSPGTGRGAPEIDILEGSVDPNNRIGVVTQSFQVAPFDVMWRPNSDFMAMPNYNTTQMNGYTGGPFQQAVSATTLLNNNWYDGNEYQKYAFEYIPGTSKGKIAWFVGEDPSFIMDGRAIGPNGNVGARQVSEEPMAMILNLGFSHAWGEVLLGDLKFPTIMHVDYVRIYQPKGNVSVTCDPPGYPTTKYIADHPIAYQNPNMTAWDQTGYGWPKHTLTGC